MSAPTQRDISWLAIYGAGNFKTVLDFHLKLNKQVNMQVNITTSPSSETESCCITILNDVGYGTFVNVTNDTN